MGASGTNMGASLIHEEATKMTRIGRTLSVMALTLAVTPLIDAQSERCREGRDLAFIRDDAATVKR
jgi:hypothetical protein